MSIRIIPKQTTSVEVFEAFTTLLKNNYLCGDDVGHHYANFLKYATYEDDE